MRIISESGEELLQDFWSLRALGHTIELCLELRTRHVVVPITLQQL